jgi:uncharacterized protein YegJ (DUF2314 family)
VAYHLILPYSCDDNGFWITTVGMEDYGLPEIECNRIPKPLIDGALFIVIGLARRIILDATAKAGRQSQFEIPNEVTLSKSDIKGAFGGCRESCADDTSGAIGLRYRHRALGGHTFLSITTPPGIKSAFASWLERTIKDLIDTTHQQIDLAPDDPELVAAVAKARAELPEIKQRFLGELMAGKSLAVKRGFPYGESDDIEHMWIRVETWSDDRIVGELANAPTYAKQYVVGDTVEALETEVTDWLIFADGVIVEGGYTVQVLQGRSGG